MGGVAAGGIALPSMVPRTMDSMLNPLVATLFPLSHPMIFDRSTISDRLRFAFGAHGLRWLLRRENNICAPCGWKQGAKWGHIRV